MQPPACRVEVKDEDGPVASTCLAKVKRRRESKTKTENGGRFFVKSFLAMFTDGRNNQQTIYARTIESICVDLQNRGRCNLAPRVVHYYQVGYSRFKCAEPLA
jgi:hypothetical protein